MLRYLELFAGSGAASVALDALGFECVGYSEVDPYKIQNYDANFPGRTNYGDITKIDPANLPDFELLVGGSPCTDLSIAKKNNDGIVGTESKLFYDYIRLLNGAKPKYFIFENVKGLLISNRGEDFEIVKTLLGEHYHIKYEVLNTKEHGIPQSRPRIYIVGQRKDLGEFHYQFPKKQPLTLTVHDYLEERVDDKYYLTENMQAYVLNSGTKGFTRKIETDLDIACCLLKTMTKMHRAGIDNYYHTEYQPVGKTNLRRITPREAARLQGFDDSYKFVVSDSRAYMAMGDAMSVNVVKAVSKQLLTVLNSL